MFVIGTALAVGPFNESVTKIKDRCPCVLINLENTASQGYDFEDLENKPGRLFIPGKCDVTIA
jgi:hypothetical protein